MSAMHQVYVHVATQFPSRKYAHQMCKFVQGKLVGEATEGVMLLYKFSVFLPHWVDLGPVLFASLIVLIEPHVELSIMQIVQIFFVNTEVKALDITAGYRN